MTDPHINPAGEYEAAASEALTAISPPPAAFESSPTSVPVHVESASQRAKRLRTKKRVINLADEGEEPIEVEIRGMDANSGLDMAESMEGVDENDPKAGALVMARALAWEVGTNIRFFPESEWSDEEILQLPLGALNQILTMGNFVLGKGTEPGKD